MEGNMRKENELDFLENHIPSLAQNALKKAYVDTLSRGASVLEIINGKMLEVFPDGTQKFIKNVESDIKIKEKNMVIK